MKSNKGSVTIRDVAKAAGVSVSTVSRVLNDKDDVAAETYEKVQAVIAELGYASSLAAKSMRSHKTNVIGLVIPELEDPFAVQVIQGVNQAIKGLDFDLLIYTSGDINIDSWVAREQQYVSLLNGSVVDGIIVVTPAGRTFTTNFPLVAIDPHLDSADFPAVIAANKEGALSVMTYLLELGHRRIGFITGRPYLQSAIQRLEGYKAGLEKANILIDPDLIQEGNFTQEIGYKCAKALLTLPNPPTAIFAANDSSAIGAIQAANELGLHIPDDLSVVGFDNILASPYVNGGLTTVDQYIEKMGHAAVKMLIELIQQKSLDKTVYRVPTELIVRNTCQEVNTQI
ncbi:MAG: LacI family DNA-binding transcriptional regulator [Chloroflexota bacterium]